MHGYVQQCCGMSSIRNIISLVLQIKTENKALQEKVARLETEAEELRRIRKMLESKLY